MSAVKLHSPGKTIGSPVMADPLTSEYVQGSYIIRAPPDRAPRREVLKWLQGLDLSHSVRNVRRDAANGYVVAEICSRYFPSDINMHSFENGASLKVKASNWDALVRFCRRAAPGVRLERELLLYVVHGALHLCGLDDHEEADRSSMRAAEGRVMERLGFAPDEGAHEAQS